VLLGKNIEKHHPFDDMGFIRNEDVLMHKFDFGNLGVLDQAFFIVSNQVDNQMICFL
jgi:hypothetical protein